jgi:hypothetical protein
MVLRSVLTSLDPSRWLLFNLAQSTIPTAELLRTLEPTTLMCLVLDLPTTFLHGEATCLLETLATMFLSSLLLLNALKALLACMPMEAKLEFALELESMELAILLRITCVIPVLPVRRT